MADAPAFDSPALALAAFRVRYDREPASPFELSFFSHHNRIVGEAGAVRTPAAPPPIVRRRPAGPVRDPSDGSTGTLPSWDEMFGPAPARVDLTRPSWMGYGMDSTIPDIESRQTTTEDHRMKPKAPASAPVSATPPATVTAPAPTVAPAPAPAPTVAPRSTGLTIVRAEKRRGRLRVALTGPSGGGKTYSSLVLAAGIVGTKARPDGRARVLVVDTENGSANDYGANADGVFPIVPFDLIDIRPPYTVEKYEKAYSMAVGEGYDLVVFDSLTHAWKGEGGMLDDKEKADARGGGKFQNWGPVTAAFNRFRAMILNNATHLIATMRSKMDYAVDERGKPTKVGLAPEMRDGMEYEFTVVFDLDIRHQAAISKDRTGVFAGRALFVPTAATGKELIDWRMSGRDEVAPPTVIASAPIAAPVVAPVVNGVASASDEIRASVRALLESLNLDARAIKATLGIPSGPLSQVDAERLFGHLSGLASGGA